MGKTKNPVGIDMGGTNGNDKKQLQMGKRKKSCHQRCQLQRKPNNHRWGKGKNPVNDGQLAGTKDPIYKKNAPINGGWATEKNPTGDDKPPDAQTPTNNKWGNKKTLAGHNNLPPLDTEPDAKTNVGAEEVKPGAEASMPLKPCMHCSNPEHTL